MSKNCGYSGRNLSLFKTFNCATHYSEIYTPQDAINAFDVAEKLGIRAISLGEGSNVFFKNKNVKSYILKNALPEEITYLGEDSFYVSSSTKLIKLLRAMKDDSRDCFYYLASAPCQIGGAIVMNAGSGPRENLSISDYIESVKFVHDGKVNVIQKSDSDFSYRCSKFQKIENCFILGAIFKFSKTKIIGNPISERIEWAKLNQDLSAPNCGSLCSTYNASILKFVRFLFKPFPAGLSAKKLNWAFNKSPNPIYLKAMLFCITALHKIFRKKLKFELKIYS